jgi:hypothetical protein
MRSITIMDRQRIAGVISALNAGVKRVRVIVAHRKAMSITGIHTVTTMATAMIMGTVTRMDIVMIMAARTATMQALTLAGNRRVDWVTSFGATWHRRARSTAIRTIILPGIRMVLQLIPMNQKLGTSLVTSTSTNMID